MLRGVKEELRIDGLVRVVCRADVSLSVGCKFQ